MGYRREKVILLRGKVRQHREKPTQQLIFSLGWEVIQQAAISPDLAPSGHHLFRPMSSDLKDQRFMKFEDVRKCLDGYFASKLLNFYQNGIHYLPNKSQKTIDSKGEYSYYQFL